MAGSGSMLTHLRGAAILTPWVLWLLLADTVISLQLPLKLLAPNFVYNSSSRIAETVWYWIQVIFERYNGANLTFSGDAIPRGESAIVVANHVGWADFYMIQALAIKAGMLGRCRYFAKIQLRIVPFLGWGLWAMGMPMVSRNWSKDRHELDRAFSGIVNRQWPTWLISFSEATRFTKKKYEQSIVWCKESGRPQPKHLLYPRTKGFITTVQHLRQAPHIKAVYDVTIAYQRGNDFQTAPTMWDTLSVPGLSSRHGYKFHVHVRRFPLDTLPTDDEKLAKWLENLWVEKGEWLSVKKAEWASTA
ncbi:1-acyl-sn-glycerol-3-phosphate acyltransferase delta [Colletotrichum sidae]|uniref:1-acyl-sn-glycerol-3-phosphate acyltransferase delta n=3 Tax=Colletotrichum orbiculare species complex TaxID=2707354 RepID=N4UMJ0_COLOR|nr:1-acyl-sn-glycerol-3-phosphate acyltransferase delta [Colletotrichum orbiculare MAFF 240422]TDZ65862.1 1-acyl-sn-glycerol-3-phosphate acyltransferase delta [Colletotrichum trifolii]TEA12284.1 1-acyl-sn-glycerol-3-phosphate acyltransferase delta [Colletotrichum sidae]